MVRLILSCLFVALLTVAIYSFIVLGHCFPALGIAIVAGAATAWVNPLAGRQRAPRMIGALIFIGSFWVSHRFAGVPDKGPHRLAYDAQYLALYVMAILAVRQLKATAA